MASKSKRARLAEQQKSKSVVPVIFWSFTAALLGYLQNKYGQFSDIRGFYGMRFMDGQHHWPYDAYTPVGGNGPLQPVEYPAITGVAIWLLTFITPVTGIPILNYFGINVVIHAIFFAATGLYIKKLTNNSTTYLFVLAPACFMALNLNWDMWAVLPMVASIYYFEKEKRTLSAVLLGIAIAAKFFPVVLLLPIAIYFLRGKQIKRGLKYLAIVLASWLAFNLPVMLISFNGWKYFYTFSFNRGLGDGSIYSVLGKLGLGQVYSNPLYYALNITLFGLLIFFFFKSKINLSLAETAFLTMFCFTYFGKQYSMQYVLWLTPLAVIHIATMEFQRRNKVLNVFYLWQTLELAFRLSYFQNMLTNIYQNTDNQISHQISNSVYGCIGLLRYVTFAALLVLVILVQKYPAAQSVRI